MISSCSSRNYSVNCLSRAEVAKLVYALVLGTSVERLASSSLALGTNIQLSVVGCQSSDNDTALATGFFLKFVDYFSATDRGQLTTDNGQ